MKFEFPPPEAPPISGSDDVVAQGGFAAWSHSERWGQLPNVEDWRGYGGDSSDNGCLHAAIAAAKDAGGLRLRVPAHYYSLEETLLIDTSHTALIGQGCGFSHIGADTENAPRTKIVWDGPAGGTILRFNTPAGLARQVGGGLQGIMLDGKDFSAARGLVLESWCGGIFSDLYVWACSESQIRFEVVDYVLAGTGSADTQRNLFVNCFASTFGKNTTPYFESTAIGWHLTGGSPTNAGNTSGNIFHNCHGKVSLGLAWKLENCDDNAFYFTNGSAAYDDDQFGLELGSQDQDSTSGSQPLGPGASRNNMFFGTGTKVHARASQTGLNSSRNNNFYAYTRANAFGLPVLETPAGGSLPPTINYLDTLGTTRMQALGLVEDVIPPSGIAGLSQLYIDEITGPVKLRDGAGTTRQLLDTASQTGDWTPVFSFLTPGDSVITHTVQLGKYQKLGSFVLLMLDVEFNTNAFTTAAGVAQITGLPFPSSVIEGSLTLGISHATFSAGQILRLAVPASGSAIFLRIITSNAVVTNASVASILPSKTGIRIRGVGMYWTAA